ncbi:MAG: ATP-binding protein [Actinomycetota bacterium]|nr:ATP-binding protein [Actinomycetota bacterium]
MRLVRLSVTAYRGYRNTVSIDVSESLTALVGKNDAGKSSLFDALSMFLSSDKIKPEDADFPANQQCEDRVPIEIACTFADLPKRIVLDADSDTSFEREHLLDETGNLTIVKRWTTTRGSARTFIRCQHPESNLFDGSLLSKKINELKKLCKQMGIDTDGFDARVSSNFREAIWRLGIDNGSCILRLQDVDVSVGDDIKSIQRNVTDALPAFHLFRSDRQGTEGDDLAQDPAKSIALEVLAEHEDVLAELTEQIEEKIKGMLEGVIEKLAEISPGLAASLSPRNLRPDWRKSISSVQFQDENGVPLARRGSGTRRLVLLSFFRALAELQDDHPAGKGSIIAIEEPETSLHPDMQNDVWAALADVAEAPCRQVLLTTHSPNLIGNLTPESVRYILAEGTERRVISIDAQTSRGQLLHRLASSMGALTDHFIRCFIMVEGRNDIASLNNLCSVLHKGHPQIYPNLLLLQQEGVVCVIPIGGCAAAELWEERLVPLKRPAICILDSDKKSAEAMSGKMATEWKGGSDPDEFRTQLCVLNRREMENYLTLEAFLSCHEKYDGYESAAFLSKVKEEEGRVGPWNYLDLPNLSARLIHEASSGKPWEDLSEECRRKKEGQAKKRLADAFSLPCMARIDQEGENDFLEILKKITKWTTGVPDIS